MNTKLPSKLYKYQPYSIQTIDNLKNGCIWFSKPSKFNDPFDNAIPYVFDGMTDEEWRVLYKRTKRIWESMKDEAYKISTESYFSGDEPSDDFKKNYILASDTGWVKKIKAGFNQQGIACFSEIVDNILMWSHYSDGHRGFCLEFDTSFYPFSKAVQVQYSDALPSFKSNDNEILLDSLVTTKSIDWSYEKEWRLIHNQGDIEYCFDTKALTGIYFGSEMSFVHIEMLSLAVRGSLTKLYRMKRAEREFKVEFERVTYTPYEYGKTKRKFIS